MSAIKGLTAGYLLVLAFVFSSIQVSATHIVGGEISYKQINSSKYEVTLLLFIDCINGTQGALDLDSMVNIGVFDHADHTLTDTFYMRRNGPKRLTDNSYNCIIPPSSTCVDMYTYKKVIELASSNDGYDLVFQRCCRNHTITNLIVPESTGATYSMRIPGKSLAMHNSSPVFKTLPPNFLCVGQPFTFDHSATDADGDSLAYGLYTPLNGGSQVNAAPRPPAKPPYQEINWRNPYNGLFPMGAVSMLIIDPHTGILKVTPDAQGQFVVGISVKEYRNGILLGEMMRDYQFNVLACQKQIKAEFNAPALYCRPEVNFTNSGVADSFLWDFGVKNSLMDTSTQLSPTFVFPHEGRFTVKQVAFSGSCKDSMIRHIEIRSPDSYKFAIGDTTLCTGDSIRLGASTADDGYKVLWSPDRWLSSPSSVSPWASPDESTTYTVTKIYKECTFTDTVLINVSEPQASFTFEVVPECDSVVVVVTNTSQSASAYSWYMDGKLVSKEVSPVFRFSYGEMASGCLTASSGKCTDTYKFELKLPSFSEAGVIIPNVITPNGDGLNDCFEVQYKSMRLYCLPDELSIYNRWGNLIYDNSQRCWEGTPRDNRSALPEGTYYYVLKIAGNTHTGTIMLLR